ncbi:MAG: cation transporter [Gammaproteobacteria bacterium]|nr:cation transporter [Gammaproteobacteria bacterium]
MSDCCSNAGCETAKLRESQAGTLKAVLLINAAMFAAELTAGLVAGSTALLADSLDMLGDTLVYGFSLYVVARSDGWKAGSAFVKSGIMAAFGLFVLGQAVYKVLHPALPEAGIIGAMGLLALAANTVCFALLWRHRAADVNMRSVWLCSRNDIIANLGVLAAAAGVWLLHSQWPDVVIGLAIALLFLHSALAVFRDALQTHRAHRRRLTEAWPTTGGPRSGKH